MERLDNILEECRSVCDRWPCLVVGGGVRDLLLNAEPQDYDVFFLGSSSEELRDLFRPVSVDMHQPYRRSGNLCGEIIIDGDLVQVCQTDALTLDDMFDRTDWNASLFGYDGTRVEQRVELDHVRPGQRLRLMNVSNPINTLGRGFRLAERLSMVFHVQDVLRLCRMITDSPRPERVRVRSRRSRRPAAVGTISRI